MTPARGKAGIRRLPGLVAIALAAVVGLASANFNSPTLLFDTPTADVLPAGSFAVSASMTGPLTRTSQNVPWWEADARVGFSPVEHLHLAVTAYTLKDYVLDAKYQLVGGGPGRFGLAVGAYDIGLQSYISPLGHGFNDAWPDWKYDQYLPRYDRLPERFSAYAVTSIPVTGLARINIGLGRGRFVGYDARSKYFNTDIFFNEYHRWAIALFGGLEVYVAPKVALVAEATSRDFNTGVKADFGPVSAAIAWTKMEGLLFSEGDERFGRIELGATWRFGPKTRKAQPVQPESTLVPVPAPEPEPEQPPVAEKLQLHPIWFNWDKWDITEAAAATLRRNAQVILTHPEIKGVAIFGNASEEGTTEHNLPLSNRRAMAAFNYLESLGVPAGLMHTQALGELAGRPLPLRRTAYFEIQE